MPPDSVRSRAPLQGAPFRSAPCGAALALLAAAALPAALPSGASAATLLVAPQQLPLEAEWCLGAAATATPAPCIALEVADTMREQILGLQKRPPLPPLRGMWFRYPQPQPVRFWMHQTPSPLDMIFIRAGRVIAIEANAAPCPHLPCPSYGPEAAVDGVVELAAGQAAALGIQVGSAAPIGPLRRTAPAAAAPD